MEHTEHIGARIATRRKSLGMTQRDLAEQLHITDQAVSRWERGVGAPDISLLAPLSRILDIDLEELLTGQTTGRTNSIPPMPAPMGIPQLYFRLYRWIGWTGLLVMVAGAWGEEWGLLPSGAGMPLFFTGLLLFLLAGVVIYPLLLRCPGCGHVLSVFRPKPDQVQHCPRCGKALFLDSHIRSLRAFLQTRHGQS